MKIIKQLKPWVKITAILIGSLIGILIICIAAIGLAYLFANQTNGSIVSSGEIRTYLLYVPQSYNPDSPAPLVISFHGFADWPAHQARMSHWNDLAEEEGFIVVYPSGSNFPLRWRTGGLSSTSGTSDMDVQFISDLIDKLEQEYNIDPQRIYANGLSNGGGMSVMLACNLSERIAAIGSVAGGYTYPLEECNPSRPIPMIAFHGDADPIVPYNGGPSRSFDIPFPSVPEWIEAWADRNRCVQTIKNPAIGEIHSTHYSNCDQNANVIFYTISGGGHTWPGGRHMPSWITGYTSDQIDATRIMWKFFSQHPLSP